MSNLIPHQKTGKTVNLSHTETFASIEEAAACFQQARTRLFNPNIWHELCGILSAKFYLVPNGGTKNRMVAEVDDNIKIDIPAPGPVSGEGYDWVLVDSIEDNPNQAGPSEKSGMKLRPCSDPNTSEDNTAHFFTEEASSTFIIERIGNVVASYYYGRNETPNIHTDRKLDNIRNTIVASGAMASLSEIQWICLIKGFLNKVENE